MGEIGLFHGIRAELIGGEIMVLSPQNFSHTSTTDRVAEVLRAAFGHGFWVRSQSPVNLGKYSEPEPDVSVVRNAREDYADHPTTALLIVEVSDSTLAYNRRHKASLYASVGIADYWIVNSVHNQDEVYRNPVVDSAQPFGFRYADAAILRVAGDTVSPLAKPTAQVNVSDLLPT
jgi:Uma2 family endonuclease